jgi:hypothetical protein
MGKMARPFAERLKDALLCQSCRRYRRGLFVVLVVALTLWASGRWTPFAP